MRAQAAGIGFLFIFKLPEIRQSSLDICFIYSQPVPA